MILKARRATRPIARCSTTTRCRNLLDYMQADPAGHVGRDAPRAGRPAHRQWVNLGGQLVPADDVDRLLADIEVRRALDVARDPRALRRPMAGLPAQKQAHALACSEAAAGRPHPRRVGRPRCDEAVRIQEYVRDQVYAARKKDYDNPFRQITFRNAARNAGRPGHGRTASFVKQVRGETEAFAQLITAVKVRSRPGPLWIADPLLQLD